MKANLIAKMRGESSNVGLAHELSAPEHAAADTWRGKWLGLAEAFVLAIVAVATAWSGYQASRWEGLSAQDYALYERFTVLSQAKETLAGQERLYDIITFNDWIVAKTSGHDGLAALFERRFRPEYAAAFRAWLRLDPLHSRNAPPGPIFMREYRSANAGEGRRLASLSAQYFNAGIASRDRGDDYVRVTVFLATVLFLTALSQRLGLPAARAIIVTVAGIFLLVSVFWIITLPRT